MRSVSSAPVSSLLAPATPALVRPVASRPPPRALGLLLGLALSAWACGDDDGPARPDAAVDSGRPGDGGGGATLRARVLRVTEPFPSDATEPASGVSVAADLPGGGRVEATTGADGTVAFDGVRWPAGSATLVAWESGYAMAAVTNVAEADGEVALYLLPILAPAPRVALSGTATGMMDAAHLLIASSTAGGYHEGTGPAFTLEVPSGQAGTLVGLELSAAASGSGRGQAVTLHAATTTAYPAPAAPATAGLDFSMPVATTTVTGSLPLPTAPRSASVLGDADLFIRVTGHDVASAFLGAQTRLDLSTDGAMLEFDVEHVTPPAVTRPLTQFFLTRPPETSAVLRDGWPAAGPQAVEFLDPPTILAPEFGVDSPWADTIRWESVSVDLPVIVRVTDVEESLLRAYVVVRPGRSSVALPAPPGTTSVADVVGGGTPQASAMVCDDAGSVVPWVCSRFATSRTFGLTP